MDILSLKSKNFQKKVQTAPRVSGCYIYFDAKKNPIYIGKAKNLFNRIKSYFSNFQRLDPKTKIMISKAKDLKLLTVDSELEALFLENNLIKKYKPKYNILMRDDKSFIYVGFEKPKKGVIDFPKIKIFRTRDAKNNSFEYFGPYLNTVPIKSILKSLRKIFPYVSCNRSLIEKSSNPVKIETNNKTPCLYYHLNLCKAPCASLQNKADYLKNFNSIKSIFNGKIASILNNIEKEMLDASKNKNFEKAANLRDKIFELKYIKKNIKIDNDVDDVVIDKLKKEEREKGLNELISALNFPKEVLCYHKNFKIECFDISNIQGKFPTGSMTVMIDGTLMPNLYRKFKIKTKDTPDDFLMMQEIIKRRFNNFYLQKKRDQSFSIFPDLVILDGGKGQLSAVYKIFRKLNLDRKIPIIALAKREEEIFKINYQFYDHDDYGYIGEKMFKRIYLKRNSESLYLVQRIRDEAHRFGLAYHKNLRSKALKVK